MAKAEDFFSRAAVNRKAAIGRVAHGKGHGPAMTKAKAKAKGKTMAKAYAA